MELCFIPFYQFVHLNRVEKHSLKKRRKYIKLEKRYRAGRITRARWLGAVQKTKFKKTPEAYFEVENQTAASERVHPWASVSLWSICLSIQVPCSYCTHWLPAFIPPGAVHRGKMTDSSCQETLGLKGESGRPTNHLKMESKVLTCELARDLWVLRGEREVMEGTPHLHKCLSGLCG